ncbi:Calx-beta domain-containing protein, partial [Variovorax sp. YR752]|uniref:Calx-beta domain-containing protein n=1 Tax=Variovorax sp. YR752 TaxID=1884383 RepID=UPI003137A499
MSNPDVLGWLAAGLMVATFGCREAGAMRPLAVATNLAFIGYGVAALLVPVLTLHLLLLPINLWRWAEVLRAKESLVKLMNLLRRSAPALALAACVVLSACGGGGGDNTTPSSTTPPVTLTEIQREWTISDIRARGRHFELLEKADTDQNIAVSVDRELDGGLAFVPPEYPGKSRPQAGVFSRPGGMTFGAYADAPGLSPLNGDDAVGSQSLLIQSQAFRKDVADATLEFVVSYVWIDLIDDNPEPPTHAECPWQGGGVVDCNRVMYAWVDYILFASADADRSGNSYERYVAYKDGFLQVSGWRDNFNHVVGEEDNGAAIKPEPLWDASDFDVLPAYDVLGKQNRLLVMLKRPKVISIPIDTLPVGAEIHVQTFSVAETFNHRQRESFASAYLRDPANAGGAPGAEIRTSGLSPVPIQSGTVFDPNGDDTPQCSGAPDPLAGTIGFGQASYAEPEIPGRGAPITLVRSGGAKGQVSVRLRTLGGTATPAVDYEAQDKRLVFLEGQTSLTLRLPILLDPTDEGNETVDLELSELRGCA